jgi:hypothetical protein
MDWAKAAGELLENAGPRIRWELVGQGYAEYIIFGARVLHNRMDELGGCTSNNDFH